MPLTETINHEHRSKLGKGSAGRSHYYETIRFGHTASPLVEKIIVKRFYDRIGLAFMEEESFGFEESIDRARHILYRGSVHLSSNQTNTKVFSTEL
jgi:hypothetical protein